MANTTLVYNGVSIDWIKTNKFEQEAVRDESDTDLIYSHITIGVTGVLNTCIQGENPWVWMDENRSKLLEPRKKLYFNCDGDELIQSPPVGFEYDAKLGPKPKTCNITKMDGSTFMIYYEIETWLVDCVISEGQPQPILNNRWEVTTNVDSDYYATRTINGLLVFNGYYIDQQAGNALAYAEHEGLIVPKIPDGWKREQINVKLSADGLKLNYTIVDKEQHFAIPKPAVSISATYQETAGGGKAIPDMHIQMNEVNVTVRGQPGSDQAETGRVSATMKDLMKIMMQIVLSRINPDIKASGTGANPVGEWITFFSMKEDLFKNEVSVRVITCQTRNYKDTKAALTMDWANGNFAFTRIGTAVKVADINNNKARYPDDKGNYLLWLFSAKVQTACSTNKSINITDYNNYTHFPTSVDVITVTRAPTSIPGLSPTTTNEYSKEHYTFPFTEYTIDIKYAQDYHTIQLPVMYSGATHCYFVKTAAPTLKKTVYWKAMRVGDYPLLPKPDNIAVDATTGLVEDKLLHTDVNLSHVELESDGFTRRYTISGIYEYGCYRYTDWAATFDFVSAVNPVTQDAWGSYPTKVPSTKFVVGILGPGAAPGGGSPVP